MNEPADAQTRDTLLEALWIEVSQLHQVYRLCGSNVGIFLHQSLALYADEETLVRVIADVRAELAHLSELTA
jgi:hypothetical protein